MISIIRFFFISILLILSGCIKNEFKMEFALPDSVNANYKISYYASDKRGGMMIETVAAIANGKGILKGITRNPAILFLSQGSRQTIAIYVQRGDNIKISGKDANPYTWEIEGNDLNKEWSQWRIKNEKVLSESDPKKTNSLVAKYIYDNPASPLSTLMLLTAFSRKDDETLFRRLWLTLTGEARDPEWTGLVARADQQDTFVAIPARLESIALRSFGNGIDTLRTDSANASMLFFWYAGFPQRKEYIDSLRSIAKEFPDSATRIIADICLEPDSIAWRSPIRSDSLSKVVRAWAPAGFADSRLINLNVTSAPFFIIFSKDGNQRYRGSDINDAFSEFRKIIHSSNP